jgi:hypothetical protein
VETPSVGKIKACLCQTFHGTEIEIVTKKAIGSLLVYAKEGDILYGKKGNIISTKRVAMRPRHCVSLAVDVIALTKRYPLSG